MDKVDGIDNLASFILYL